jgi:hypothetical protein
VSTEELETAATESVALDGDDITVIREPHDGGNRRRIAWIAGGVVVVLVGIAAVAYAVQDDDPSGAVSAASPTTLAETPDAAAVTTVPKAVDPAPTTAVVLPSSPAAPPVRVPPSAPVAIAPPAGPAVTTPVATTPPPGSPSDLQWTAPASLRIKTGTSVTITVKATNPARGVVTLPTPLSCAPTLDNSGMCVQTTQEIAAGQSASAQWKIDAAGIAPGTYTMNPAGHLRTPDTVTA